MKLLVDLDQESGIPISDDILVLTREGRFKLYPEQVIPFRLDYADDDPVVSEQIRELFSNLPEGYAPLMNTAFRNIFRVVSAAIAQIDEILSDKKVDELIFAGGYPTPVFTLVGGDGEGVTWRYSSALLLNPILNEYYHGRIKVNWIARKSLLTGRITSIVRKNLLYLKFIKRLMRRQSSTSTRNYRVDGNLIGFVNSDLQLDHFRRVLSKEVWENATFVSPFASVNVKSGKIFKVEPGVNDYLSSLIWSFGISRSLNGKFSFELNDGSFTIPLKSFASGLQFSLVEHKAIYQATRSVVKGLVPSNIATFISNMTYGNDIVLVNDLSKAFNVEHINYQSVTMGKVLFPQLKLADTFYLFESDTHDLLSRYEKSYVKYFPVNASNQVRPEIKANEPIKLALFTQPDHFTSKYLEFLSNCAEVIERRNLNVIIQIKPHYRQDRLDEFRKLSSTYSFVEILESMEYPREVMQKSHFMMSMTSSVLFEAFQEGCPGIILGLYETDLEFIRQNCYPEINHLVTNMEEFIAIIENPESSRDQYFENRNRFLNQENSANDVL